MSKSTKTGFDERQARRSRAARPPFQLSTIEGLNLYSATFLVLLTLSILGQIGWWWSLLPLLAYPLIQTVLVFTMGLVDIVLGWARLDPRKLRP